MTHKTMELTIKNIIAESQLDLGLTNDDSSPIMSVWAYDAIRTIGASRANIIKGEWKILSNIEINKPKNIIAPILITISIDKKCCVYPYFNQSIAKCGCCMNCSSDCDIQIGETDKTFYLSSNAKKYKYYKLDYVGSPLNDDGDIIIEETMARAVKQYISFMFKRRKRNMEKDSIPMSEIQDEENRWIRLMKASRGRKNMLHMGELEDIGNTWMRAGINIQDYLRRH